MNGAFIVFLFCSEQVFHFISVFHFINKTHTQKKQKTHVLHHLVGRSGNKSSNGDRDSGISHQEWVHCDPLTLGKKYSFLADG